MPRLVKGNSKEVLFTAFSLAIESDLLETFYQTNIPALLIKKIIP